MVETAKDIVEVVTLTGVPRALAYRVPEDMKDAVDVGFLVRVPLLNRSVLGVVVCMGTEQEIPAGRMKYLSHSFYKVPIMTGDLLTLAVWIQKYYAASAESVYEAMIPASVRRGMASKVCKFLKVVKGFDVSAIEKLRRQAPKQAVIYEYVKNYIQGVSKSSVLETLGVGASSCRGLIDKGLVVELAQKDEREAYSDGLSAVEFQESKERVLTEEQGEAFASVAESIDAGVFKVHLLHGVTGSGKTEVYLRAMRKVLEPGGSVLFLVPEVSLTPQTVGRMRARLECLGVKTVVWHSQLSEGERFDAWMALAKGEARVVVGARSAIFAPMKYLKLIVVDEEHDPAYKQGEVPRYHGRDVAVYRAMLQGVVCILGSATPSLESLYNVEVKGYCLNRLRKRVDDREMPRVHIVDMKPELLKARKPVTLSTVLVEKLWERFEAKEQSILFINRRGYSSSMLCPDCGFVAECNHCSVSLTHHRTDESLRCHVCGHRRGAPRTCPKCSSEKVRWKGFGTQRVEDIVQKVMPGAKVVRMDADTMSKKNLFREILADFRRGKIDVLVGTQMISKGLDFPNVTLVGLIDADLSLHIQDFRASERTFQLVVQVAGRAGRGDRAGEVVVQTYMPHSAAIQFAKRSEFEGFLEDELEQRREFNYPPYRHIIRHIFRGRNKEKVEFYAEQWVLHLEKHLEEAVEIRGPIAAPLEKVKDNYRFHLWIFLGQVSRILPKIVKIREGFQVDKEVVDVIDVDPVDMS